MMDHITDALIDVSDNLKRVSETTHHCILANCLIKSDPSLESESVNELLFGEGVELLSVSNGWAYIVCDFDGYVGWIPDTALGGGYMSPTHRVCVPSTHLYERPDIKSQPLISLPIGSELTVDTDDTDSRFLKTSKGWVFEDHVFGVNASELDPVNIARRFLGTPYLWGGRTYAGLDCSALIQIPLKICGHRVPRDSSMQFKVLGRLLADDEEPQYGDIAFFSGHVGWMVDGDHVLHANATHMAVTVDPLSDVIKWVAAETDKEPFLGFRRMDIRA